MSRAEKAALTSKAAELVREVVVEVYGQRASKKSVAETAKRVVETILPAKMAGQSVGAQEAR